MLLATRTIESQRQYLPIPPSRAHLAIELRTLSNSHHPRQPTTVLLHTPLSPSSPHHPHHHHHKTPPLSFFPCLSLLVQTSLLVKLPAPSNNPPFPNCPPTALFTPSWIPSMFLSPVIFVFDRLSVERKVLVHVWNGEDGKH